MVDFGEIVETILIYFLCPLFVTFLAIPLFTTIVILFIAGLNILI